jgi:hypothetical protein
MRYRCLAPLALILPFSCFAAALAAPTTGHPGHAAGAINIAATTNSNGPVASDRDKGRECAADRRSAKGAAQEKAAPRKQDRAPAMDDG